MPVKITVFRDVTWCTLVDCSNISDEPAASIFRVEGYEDGSTSHSEALVNTYQLLHRSQFRCNYICYVYFYDCIDYMELIGGITANDAEETGQGLRALFYHLSGEIEKTQSLGLRF
jgi:hypothetical protein